MSKNDLINTDRNLTLYYLKDKRKLVKLLQDLIANQSNLQTGLLIDIISAMLEISTNKRIMKSELKFVNDTEKEKAIFSNDRLIEDLQHFINQLYSYNELRKREMGYEDDNLTVINELELLEV